MSDFVVTLPSRPASIQRLVNMPADEQPMFIGDICAVLWDHEDDLPDEVKHKVRGWLAHRMFAEDPVTQTRREEVKARARGAVGEGTDT